MSQTIAVALTGKGAGAIGVIALSGPGAGAVLANVAASRKAERMAVGAIIKTRLLAGGPRAQEAREVVDEGLIVRVGAERFELHVHGGVAVMQGVLAALAAAGARVVALEEAQELIGGGIEAEVMLALRQAVTESGLRLLLPQPRAWAAWTQRWRAWLQGAGGAAALWQLQAQVQWVLARSVRLGRLLEPARVAIVGPPNAGKSTLANALLGRAVSITSDIAGTTRDWVDARAIFVAGEGAARLEVPVVLVDTAGVRASEDVLERASIARTQEQAGQADVVVFLADAARPADAQDVQLLDSLEARAVVVACNKCEALPPGRAMPPAYAARGGLAISALRHHGLDDLTAAVLAQLGLHPGLMTAAEAGEAEACFAFSPLRRELLTALSQCDDAARSAELLARLG